MAHRKFADAGGVQWEVWDVVPASVELGLGTRVGESSPPTAPARTSRLRVSPDGCFAGIDGRLASGWLCFTSEHEKRRLIPVPEGWERMSPRELDRLKGEAQLVPPIRRTARSG